MMDISQARVVIDVAASAGYNTGSYKRNIKGIRADAAGSIEIVDEAGNTSTFNALQGEVLSVQGKIEVTTSTAVKVQVFL